MTAHYSSAAFETAIGTTFDVDLGAEALFLHLSEVTRSGDANSVSDRPFSLLFHGPHGRRLEQGTLSLSHPGLGSLEIFVVPLGPDARGERYEAIFN